MSFTTENMSAEYNIYYGENINYDDIINYYSNFIETGFYNFGQGPNFSSGKYFAITGENLYFGGIAGDHNPPYMERPLIENSIDLYGYEIYDSVFLGNLRYASFSDESGLQDQLVFSFRGEQGDPTLNYRNGGVYDGVDANTFYEILKNNDDDLLTLNLDIV